MQLITRIVILIQLLLTTALVRALRPTCTTPATFQHPGLLHTNAEFTWVRYWLGQNQDPWTSAYNELVDSPLASLTRASIVSSTVTCGNASGSNDGDFTNDVHNAYQLALMWKLTNDTRYATRCVRILDQYAKSLKLVNGTMDLYYVVGTRGLILANAAELMRDYDGWTLKNLQRFQSMMQTVFLPRCLEWMAIPDSASYTTWSLSIIQTMMSIGVLCDLPDVYTQAVAYFTTSTASYSLSNTFKYDQGSLVQSTQCVYNQTVNTLLVPLVSAIAQTAWNQGCDLYTFNNNLILRGAEYIARYNLGYDVPFKPFQADGVLYWSQSDESRGLERPSWELIYNRYQVLLGVTAEWSHTFAVFMRPDGGAGKSVPEYDDEPGWQTLMYSYGVPDGYKYPYDMPWKLVYSAPSPSPAPSSSKTLLYTTQRSQWSPLPSSSATISVSGMRNSSGSTGTYGPSLSRSGSNSPDTISSSPSTINPSPSTASSNPSTASQSSSTGSPSPSTASPSPSRSGSIGSSYIVRTLTPSTIAKPPTSQPQSISSVSSRIPTRTSSSSLLSPSSSSSSKPSTRKPSSSSSSSSGKPTKAPTRTSSTGQLLSSTSAEITSDPVPSSSDSISDPASTSPVTSGFVIAPVPSSPVSTDFTSSRASVDGEDHPTPSSSSSSRNITILPRESPTTDSMTASLSERLLNKYNTPTIRAAAMFILLGVMCASLTYCFRQRRRQAREIQITRMNMMQNLEDDLGAGGHTTVKSDIPVQVGTQSTDDGMTAALQIGAIFFGAGPDICGASRGVTLSSADDLTARTI